MKRIAAVTMVYNEPEYLPIWCSYYGQAFGPESCYIIDHGTDDGSLNVCKGFNIIKIPRTPKDNFKRTRFVSAFCNALLEWYDIFIHTDIDEIVTSLSSISLRDVVASIPSGTYSSYGFDIYQALDSETALELHKPVTWQRRWLRFSSSMCKVVVSTIPIEWTPGFHSANSPLNFGPFYLFHLRYFDLELGLRRLARTRAMPWADARAGSHQRLPDEEFRLMMERASRLPKLPNDFTLTPDKEPLKGYIERVKNSEKDYRISAYNLDLHIFGDELFEIPPHVIGLF